MLWQIGGGFSFSRLSILNHAPPESGVYLIYSNAGWLYVGESDDMRASLLQHFSGGNPRVAANGRTLFGYECVPAEGRAVRQRELISMLGPLSDTSRARCASMGHFPVWHPDFGAVGGKYHLSMN